MTTLRKGNLRLSEHHPQKDEPNTNTTSPSWKTLYRVGGVAALITAAMTVLGVITFIFWPPPPADASVADWFALFQRSWLLGMLGLDLLILLAYVANIPLVLALYAALRRSRESLMALAVTLALVAITTYFASSRIFEMLVLSQQYAAAIIEAQRANLEAVGQSMLTTYLGSFGVPAQLSGWNYQGTAFNLSFVLWCVAAVMISFVMVRSNVFSKLTGYFGIAGNVLALGLFFPVLGVFLSLLSLPVSLVWYILSGLKLFQLAKEPSYDTNTPTQLQRTQANV